MEFAVGVTLLAMSTDENPTLWVGDEQLHGVTLSPFKEMAPPQEAGTVHGLSYAVPPRVDRWGWRVSGLSRSKLLAQNGDAILLKVRLPDGSEQTGYITDIEDEDGSPVGILTCHGVAPD